MDRGGGVENAAPVRVRPPVLADSLGAIRSAGPLLSALVALDFRSQYRGSFLSLLWPALNPLILIAIYTYVFAVLVKVRFGPTGGTTGFALYFVCGILPWIAVSEGIARSVTVVSDNVHYVKRVRFPLEILPLKGVLVGILNEAIAFAVFLPVLAACGIRPTLWMALLPLWLVPQALLTAGIAVWIASFSVFVRDLRHVVALALTGWMFLTPICYPDSIIPDRLAFLGWVNPLALVVSGFRSILIGGGPPPAIGWILLLLEGAILILGGLALFARTKGSFAEVL